MVYFINSSYKVTLEYFYNMPHTDNLKFVKYLNLKKNQDFYEIEIKISLFRKCSFCAMSSISSALLYLYIVSKLF